MAQTLRRTPPPGSKDPVFSSQQERSERAIHEFEKIAAQYGEPYKTEALYFIATNELVTNRLKAETDFKTYLREAARPPSWQSSRWPRRKSRTEIWPKLCGSMVKSRRQILL